MKRDASIDVFKGIGIILVVAGHVFPSYSYDVIFLFHMPLFFFISGYLFKPVDHFKDYVRKKLLQLMVPYCMFLLAIYIPLTIDLFLNEPHDLHTLAAFFWPAIVGGRRLYTWGSVFWFVTCFFAVLLIEARLIGRYSRRTVLAAHGAMLIASYVNALYFPDFWLIGNINVALAAAPFFYAGYLFHTEQTGHAILSSTIERYLYPASAVIATAAIATVIANHYFDWQLPVSYDMKSSVYGIPGLTFVSALACCVTLMWSARSLTDRRHISAFFSEFGQAALIIMFVHQSIAIGIARIFGEEYYFARFSVALLGSYLVYLQCRKWRWSRALLLGSERDFSSSRPVSSATPGQ